MSVNFKPNHENSCIVLAEIEGEKVTFNVDYSDIVSCIEIVKEIYDPNCKVYISGFDIVTKGTNLSDEQVINKINRTVSNKKEEKPKTLLYTK